MLSVHAIRFSSFSQTFELFTIILLLISKDVDGWISQWFYRHYYISECNHPKGNHSLLCETKVLFCDGFQIFFGLVLNHVARAYDDRKTTQWFSITSCPQLPTSCKGLIPNIEKVGHACMWLYPTSCKELISNVEVGPCMHLAWPVNYFGLYSLTHWFFFFSFFLKVISCPWLNDTIQ